MYTKKNIVRLIVSLVLIFIFLNSIVFAKTNDLNDSNLYITFLNDKIQTLYNDTNSIIANEANSVLQTRNGYIWISTYNGLIRFDGQNFIKITEETYEEFNSRNIRTLYEASDGTLYIGSNDKGIYSLKNDDFIAYIKASDLSNSVRKIAEDSKGKIFVATVEGIGVIEKDKLNLFYKSEITENNFFIDMTIVDDKIWGITNSGDIIVININDFGQAMETKRIGDKKAKAIYKDINNNIFIGTTTSEVLFFDAKNDYSVFKTIKAEGVESINSLMKDSKENIWVLGEKGYGIINNYYQFNLFENSKITSSVECVFEDYEGNYWISSSKEGVLKISKSKFLSLSSIEEINDSYINSTLFWNEKLYIATDYGITILDNQGQVKNELTEELKGKRIRSLQKDSSDNLWISTYNSGDGVIRYSKEGLITKWNKENGLTNDKVRTVLEASDGRMYVATTEGINVLYKDIIEKKYSTEEGLENPYILCMEEDENGNIYAGSDGNGIYMISKSGVTNISEPDGLYSGVILRMRYDQNNQVLFISASGKLHVWRKNSKIEEYNNYPFEGNIFDIQMMGDKLIILSSTGLYITSASSILNDSKPSVEFYAKEEGLLSSPSANSWSDLTDNGELIISTSKGVYIYYLNNNIYNNIPPKIDINKFIVDGKIYDPNKKINIPYDTSRITISMSVLSYCNPLKNIINYQLVGFDNDTISENISSTNTVTYTNLKGGDYKFVFSAINSDGINSDEEIIINIHKELSIFEKASTYIIIILITLVLIAVFVRLYIMKREKKLLTQNEKYKNITLQAIEVISRTIDAKDKYTAGHSYRVAQYSVLIAKKLEFTEEQQELLYYMALLHDIGKIGISDTILTKPGKLSDEEFDIMKNHVVSGYEILKDFTTIKDIAYGALCHHERWDGKGYINKLTGKDIPLNARIIGISDAFDAMNSNRAYRKKLTKEVIISEIEKNKGKQFDPELTDIFLRLIDEEIINIF